MEQQNNNELFGRRMHNLQTLEQKAKSIRFRLLKMIHESGAGHTGGALSSVDILVTLFYAIMNFRSDEPKWPGRDRFILSKGHSCEGFYTILADCGFFSESELAGFMQFGRLLAGHPHTRIPGVEICTGSLGHGLSVAVGMALAGKMDNASYKVFCLLGDGELDEGSVWEAASAAGHYGLDNLVAIIDRNGLQISGSTEHVIKLEPLKDRWQSFGWATSEIDGHSFQELFQTLSNTPLEKAKPSVVIARTVKGRGVSFIENNAHWHHRVPDEEELQRAERELLG